MCTLWNRIGLAAAAILGCLILAGAVAQPARAQEGSTCFDCHQERYWQYDSGRAACFSTMPGRCTDCHAGEADTWDEDLAHTGLIASPALDGAAACKACHLEDALDRAQGIGAYTGSKPQPAEIAIAPRPELALAPAPPQSLPGDSGRLVAGALFLGFGSTGVLLLGWRCWKQDCAARQS